MYQDNTKKFYVIVNRTAPMALAMNAYGHAMAGLMSRIGDPSKIDPLEYENADGGTHTVSRFPVVVLSAKSSQQIARLRRDLEPLVAQQLAHYNDFAQQMIGASAEDQMAQTRAVKADDLEFLCAVCFGSAEVLRPVTKRFSVFNPVAPAVSEGPAS
ncbi:MAG TPA: DUF2000 family protein [Thermoanaerobaculia bacterium]|jgi:hypothetical protein